MNGFKWWLRCLVACWYCLSMDSEVGDRILLEVVLSFSCPLAVDFLGMSVDLMSVTIDDLVSF